MGRRKVFWGNTQIEDALAMAAYKNQSAKIFIPRHKQPPFFRSPVQQGEDLESGRDPVPKQ